MFTVSRRAPRRGQVMGRATQLRELTADEAARLKAGLHSPKGFTVRRCQILLATANGHAPGQIRAIVGCTTTTVAKVVADFHTRGVTCVHAARGGPAPSRRGGPRIEEREPGITAALERLLAGEVAGDPMGGTSWVRSSLRKLRDALGSQGFRVDHCTIRKLVRRMGFTLKKNQKRRGGSQHPGRDEQFRYIADRRAAFAAAGLPVISIDTKKKELIGDFRNPGRAWRREPDEVNDHDFTSTAECRTVPFGIYDVGRNRGHVRVGVSNDTPEFAVTAVAEWWRSEGRTAYPGAGELLVLADCGGTNGHRHRAWKLNLQEKLCDGLGLVVTVCHYPPGCSKWNPIEHRLFSHISTNWAGVPLRSFETIRRYIAGTTTATGLQVTVSLKRGGNETGERVSDDEMRQLRLASHTVCPAWNYTLSPRPA
jgi:transposase